MLLRVLSNGLQLRLSETIVRVVFGHNAACADKHKGQQLVQNALAAMQKARRAPQPVFSQTSLGRVKDMQLPLRQVATRPLAAVRH